MTSAPRIDAHQHYWSIARGDYGWLTPALAPIVRDFNPADMAPHRERWGIAGTVLVQAAPTEAETQFLLDIAAREPSVWCVVGWADLEAADAAERIHALADSGKLRSKLRGLRPALQDIPDTGWILSPHLAPALHAMVACDLSFDALIQPRHLQTMLEFARRYPELRIVVDHGAKPDIAGGGLAKWSQDIRRVARETAMYCKLSGLVTEAAVGWRWTDLAPYTDCLLEAFGSARLMWGSDWPVVNLAGGYDVWCEARDRLLAGCAPEQLDRVLGKNALDFYRLA